MSGNDLQEKENKVRTTLAKLQEQQRVRFEKITLPAHRLKRLYLALLHSVKWKMLRTDGGNNGLD